LGEKHLKFSQKVLEILKANQLRAEIWENETISKRIRNFEIQKIPYALVIGDKELKSKTVAIRDRDKGDLGEISLDKLLEKLTKEIKSKK
ncbi:MAG TPA: His/Gly/Thr/Pro-type tRNA ligase C-terminal domain-containing protein, partial [Candidatus Paceibacterota bacterium]|nr:His/Gly/Thr/Pro-type tRNA ligase C-terminal domain-containing protein [Candidatus Paceibacterota bacterium]